MNRIADKHVGKWTIEDALAEIDALRAEIERLNSGWYDKLLAATLERDAQRLVLEQALTVLRSATKMSNARGFDLIENSASQKYWYGLRDKCDDAITAIQGVLNEHN